MENLQVLGVLPHLMLWWSPVATMSALIFMAVTARTPFARAIALGLSVLAATAYCIVVAPAFGEDWAREQYLIVAAIHTPLLCWAALGVMAGAGSNAADRFAFLFKSIEVAIVAGLYLAAGGLQVSPSHSTLSIERRSETAPIGGGLVCCRLALPPSTINVPVGSGLRPGIAD